jgi:hypothetical protein
MPAIYKPKIFGQSEIRDKVVATENHRYKVFKKKHEGGDQQIYFKLTTEYVAVNFLLFVTSDPKVIIFKNSYLLIYFYRKNIIMIKLNWFKRNFILYIYNCPHKTYCILYLTVVINQILR